MRACCCLSVFPPLEKPDTFGSDSRFEVGPGADEVKARRGHFLVTGHSKVTRKTHSFSAPWMFLLHPMFYLESNQPLTIFPRGKKKTLMETKFTSLGTPPLSTPSGKNNNKETHCFLQFDE